MKKYGRTFHLPTSPGATEDDKRMASLSGLMVSDLVITEKMDGENTTLHANGTHARSPDGGHHPSRDWVKAFAAGISPQLSDGERIVGENMYSRHAISYDALPSYFLGFAWIVDGYIQSWDATLERFESLGIHPVRTLYRGPFAGDLLESVAQGLNPKAEEGFVARIAGGFPEDEMPIRMGKFVRANHVKTDVHWTKAPMIANRLA